jgi:hypothetical protein
LFERALLPLLAALALATPAAAEAKPLASMSCRLEAGSGRLLCTVSFAEPPERRITWSDALVVAAPSAAKPLRNRVTSRSDHPDQVVLAFVIGRGEGGRIGVRARAVTCPQRPAGGACVPVESRIGYDFVPGS